MRLENSLESFLHVSDYRDSLGNSPLLDADVPDLAALVQYPASLVSSSAWRAMFLTHPEPRWASL